MNHACAAGLPGLLGAEEFLDGLHLESVARECCHREGALARLVRTVVASAMMVVSLLAPRATSAAAGNAGPVLQPDVALARARIPGWSQAGFDPAHTAFNRFE